MAGRGAACLQDRITLVTANLDKEAGDGVLETTQQFLPDQVIFHELAGAKTMEEMQGEFSELSDPVTGQVLLSAGNLVSSLQNPVQTDHAYPVVGQEVDRPGAMLEELECYLGHTYPDLLTALLEDADRALLLSVTPKQTDRFLWDQASLRLNIREAGDGGLTCQLFTFNRELVREYSLAGSGRAELGLIIDEDLLGDRYNFCHGLTIGEKENFAGKINKSDIQHLLIEKYNGRVAFRSRDCNYVVDNNANQVRASEESRLHCPQCRIFTSTVLDRFHTKRVTHEFLASDEEEEEKPDMARRRRGRPKGSKHTIKAREIEEASESVISGPGENLVKQETNRMLPEQNPSSSDVLLSDCGGGDDLDPYSDHSSPNVKRGKRRKLIPKKLQEGQVEIEKLPKESLQAEDMLQTAAALKTSIVKPMSIEVQKKTYQCSECKKECSTKQDLKLHYRKHTGGGKPFQCTLCERKFSVAQQLEVHQAVHTGEKNFLCSDCGNSFGSQSTLIDHRKRKHLNIFPHKCLHCPKSFFTRQELEAHIRTHTGDKPFVCKICNKAFARVHHLKRHQQTVHSESKRILQESEAMTEIEETETHLEISEDGSIIQTNIKVEEGTSNETTTVWL